MTLRYPLARNVLVVLALLAPGVASAQGFNAVYSRDGIDVWAAGNTGELYRSLNGGTTWSSGALGNKTLRGVAAQGFTVLACGDSGKIWRSTNSGGTWILTVATGAPRLNAVAFPNASTAYVVGAGGLILKSTDGGATWNTQTSPTAQDLNAVVFSDASTGWAVGNQGRVIRTTAGGEPWVSSGTPNVNDLLAVDFVGTTIWAAGRNGACVRSTNDGLNWDNINLKMDSRSDVLAVWMDNANTVTLGGGGGFIRKSTDGGSTWTFGRHAMYAQTSAIFFAGGTGWAANNKNRVVLRSTDGGANWSNPGGVTTAHAWQQKLVDGGSIGSSFALSGFDNRTVYVGIGSTVYISRNGGDTWTAKATVTGGGSMHALVVSPSDSNLMCAAITGSDRIARTTNGGVSWTTEIVQPFTSFGVPLEMHPDQPDTLYFMPDNGHVYLSPDFGDTWIDFSNPGFRSPCDIVVVPDTAGVILVGDGITGSGQGEIYQSTDGGVTFSLRWPDGITTGGSEVPMMSSPRLANHLAMATHWSTGGVHISNDYGKTWPRVSTVVSAWGADWAKDDPNVGWYGVYNGGQGYVTTNQGASFQNYSLSGSNYGCFVLDRGTFLAEQGGGVFKFNPVYNFTPSNTQSATLTAPNGGESWAGNSVRNITWSASNVALARLEYRMNAASPWVLIADVEGYAGTYAWTVPNVPTTDCEVRVRDAADGSPTDGSNAPFTIVAPALAANPQPLDFGDVSTGNQLTLTLTIDNPGNASLQVSNIASSDPRFWPGRTSVTVPPGGTDTVGVTFRPDAAQAYVGSLSLTSNAAGSPLAIPMSGEGTSGAMLALSSPAGGEQWQYNTAHAVSWLSALVGDIAIEYSKGSNPGNWIEIMPSIEASVGSYMWTIPNDPAGDVTLRIRELAGSLTDVSPAFSILVPIFGATLGTTDLGLVAVNDTRSFHVVIPNPGTATLHVTNITSTDGEFDIDPSSVDVPPGGEDSVEVSYTPDDTGRDTTTVSFVTDAPGSPHHLSVIGEGTTLLDAPIHAPVAFALAQNRPNPYRGSTSIHYGLPRRSAVVLEVFDVAGHRVATLRNGEEEAGWHVVPFGPDARTVDGGVVGRLASGVYFYRLQCGPEFSATRKMMLLH